MMDTWIDKRVQSRTERKSFVEHLRGTFDRVGNIRELGDTHHVRKLGNEADGDYKTLLARNWSARAESIHLQ